MAFNVWRNLSRYKLNRCVNELQRIHHIDSRNVFTSPVVLGVTGRPINMPSLSPTMAEGTIVKWLKQEGDAIVPGDVLCEIQTDKAVVSMDIEEEGVLAKIIVPEDVKDIKVGTLIALMVEDGEDYKDVDMPTASQTESSDAPPTPVAELTAVAHNSDLKIGPAAKNLLDTYGLDSSAVPATGPRHTLSKSDVLEYVKLKNLKPVDQSEQVGVTQPAQQFVAPPKPALTASAKPIESEDFVDMEVSSMRRTIAKRLTESKTSIPHAYSSISCSLHNILKLRKQFKDDNVKVSVNDFIIKAAAIALKRVPEVNCQWSNGTIKMLQDVDISIAVATESGLITPIVKNASDIGIESISDTVKELAGRARIGKLKPEEFIGGSFSISNLGMFGITEFSAVINPPQAAILAIGTSELVPRQILTEDGTDKVIAVNMMTSTLSYDSRVVIEEAAVRFMRIFKDNMEDPAKNLLDGPKCQAQIGQVL